MPLLEKRKIYAAGGSLAVTLPKGWLAYFGIKAGDEVQIVANGELVIIPTKPGALGPGSVVPPTDPRESYVEVCDPLESPDTVDETGLFEKGGE